MMGCAFASMKVCSVRERNRHMFMVPHSLRSNAETSQTDGTFFTGVALHLRGHKPPGLEAPLLFTSGGRCAEPGKQSVLPRKWPLLGVLCDPCIGYRELAVKEDGSERREESRCKDLSGSREALPGLEMLHGTLRGCGSPQAHLGGRSHPRELQDVQDSAGSSLGHPSTGILMSSRLTKTLHFLLLPLNPPEDFKQPKPKCVKSLSLKLLCERTFPRCVCGSLLQLLPIFAQMSLHSPPF